MAKSNPGEIARLKQTVQTEKRKKARKEGEKGKSGRKPPAKITGKKSKRINGETNFTQIFEPMYSARNGGMYETVPAFADFWGDFGC